jgi:catechol 2,3-dioxygenase-like lactoylglutathione lyase family enzyme
MSGSTRVPSRLRAIAVTHYAFLVDDHTFDAALDYAARAALEFGSAPRVVDRKINHLGDGRGVYVLDPDGIAYEFFTAIPG